MNNASTLRSEIKLVYQKAGVQFVISITPEGAGEGSEGQGGTTLQIDIKDAAGENDLVCTEECSPVLGDFIGGFVRWLGTIGIPSTHEGGAIKGVFHPDYDLHKLIQASGGICDMLEQRFSLYQESILS